MSSGVELHARASALRAAHEKSVHGPALLPGIGAYLKIFCSVFDGIVRYKHAQKEHRAVQ